MGNKLQRFICKTIHMYIILELIRTNANLHHNEMSILVCWVQLSPKMEWGEENTTGFCFLSLNQYVSVGVENLVCIVKTLQFIICNSLSNLSQGVPESVDCCCMTTCIVWSAQVVWSEPKVQWSLVTQHRLVLPATSWGLHTFHFELIWFHCTFTNFLLCHTFHNSHIQLHETTCVCVCVWQFKN